jgi:hypothetical protein
MPPSCGEEVKLPKLDEFAHEDHGAIGYARFLALMMLTMSRFLST